MPEESFIAHSPVASPRLPLEAPSMLSLKNGISRESHLNAMDGLIFFQRKLPIKPLVLYSNSFDFVIVTGNVVVFWMIQDRIEDTTMPEFETLPSNLNKFLTFQIPNNYI
ncbi:hypothetical protein ACH5RR_002927 [Cinchona calisaya]|uniref:Uncharacterized protein n=1 Tax=Cinchona calisaya TaxID=153742 RepID=A0ABD3ATD6_9GENT